MDFPVYLKLRDDSQLEQLTSCLFFPVKVSRLASDSQGTGDKGSPMKKHGIGKGLMTKYNGSLPKKHGIGKGLITKEVASVKKHGIGKGLMTVWHILNPDAGDFSISTTTSRSKKLGVQEKRKRLQQRQTLLVSLLNSDFFFNYFFSSLIYLGAMILSHSSMKVKLFLNETAECINVYQCVRHQFLCV